MIMSPIYESNLFENGDNGRKNLEEWKDWLEGEVTLGVPKSSGI